MAANDVGVKPGRVDFFGQPGVATWDDDKTGRVTIRVFELEDASGAKERSRTISGLFDLRPLGQATKTA